MGRTHITIRNHTWRGKLFSSCLTVTFALRAGRRSAASCWASWGQCKQSGPRREMATAFPTFIYLSPYITPPIFPCNWHFPSCPHGPHQYSQPKRRKPQGRGRERERERARERRGRERESGQQSRGIQWATESSRSFNSPLVQTQFRDSCYLFGWSFDPLRSSLLRERKRLVIVSNKEKGGLKFSKEDEENKPEQGREERSSDVKVATVTN